MAYSKTNWVNGQAPALNANNLNKIEQGIYDAQLTADTAESKADALLDRENQKELKSNKITTISAASTDTEYASAKATYTLVSDTAANLGAAIGNREQVANKVQSLSSPSSTTYPSTQAVADALDDKMDTYTASGNQGMILASDGSGGIYETSLEDGYIASQDYVDDEVQDAKDYADQCQANAETYADTEIGTANTWKYITETTGQTEVTLPSSWNEIYVYAQLSGNATWITGLIPNTGMTGGFVVNGYYINGQDTKEFGIDLTATKIKLRNYYANGQNYTSSAICKWYYR